MENIKQYSWLRKLNNALLKLDNIPLIRTFAPFDFEKLSDHLKKKFSLKSVKIDTVGTKWLSKDQIKVGLSDNVNYLSFSISPLEGNVFLLMDLEDISKLTNELLVHKNHIKFSTIMLQESYFRFVALETLNILSEMNLFQDLSAKMVEATDILNEDALCIDLKINLNDIFCYGRIAITSKFRKAWEEYFINNPPLKAFELAKTLDLIMTAELGYVKLYYQDLKKLKNGDFIVLDNINYDIRNNKGEVTLRLQDTALFLAKIKQNKLKIIDFANLQEEPNMEEKKIEKEEEEKIEAQEQKEFPAAKLEKMPITVIIEAARFKISLEKLMNMQPGNLIDLAIHPETYVNLCVNGQKIASGELVNLGETLGVRILEI
jgi:flagellar motor switch protein FliN